MTTPMKTPSTVRNDRPRLARSVSKAMAAFSRSVVSRRRRISGGKVATSVLPQGFDGVQARRHQRRVEAEEDPDRGGNRERQERRPPGERRRERRERPQEQGGDV